METVKPVQARKTDVKTILMSDDDDNYQRLDFISFAFEQTIGWIKSS